MNIYYIPNLWAQLKSLEKELSFAWSLVLTYKKIVRDFSFATKFVKIAQKVSTREKASIYVRYPRSKI